MKTALESCNLPVYESSVSLEVNRYVALIDENNGMNRGCPHFLSTLLLQFGSISPCEMNEFSDECEAWEAENGPWEKGEYMVRSNSRTMGR